jgi:hypothetical protein
VCKSQALPLGLTTSSESKLAEYEIAEIADSLLSFLHSIKLSQVMPGDMFIVNDIIKNVLPIFAPPDDDPTKISENIDYFLIFIKLILDSVHDPAIQEKIIADISSKTGKTRILEFIGLILLENKVIENIKNPTDSKFVEEILKEFSEDPTAGSRITHEGAAMFLLATLLKKKDKPYRLDNITLIPDLEFSEYLETIKSSKTRPILEKFVISGSHWKTGRISINEEGTVKVFIEESLFTINPGASSETKIIKELFPNATVYFPALQQQNDGNSCSLFALRLLMKSFNEGKFLLGHNDIFDYLEKNKKREENNDGLRVVISQSPPRSNVLAQTSHVLDTERNSDLGLTYPEKSNDIVNNKGQTFEERYAEHFLTNEQGKQINTHLSYKRQGMYEDLIKLMMDFIKKHPDSLSIGEELKSAAQVFSLQGLTERLNQMGSQATNRPLPIQFSTMPDPGPGPDNPPMHKPPKL